MANEITLQVGNRKRKARLPESWDDLDDRTFLLFYSTFFTNAGDEYTRTPFTMVKLIGMTRHLLGLDDVFMTAWEEDTKRENPENGEAIFLDELRQVVHAAMGGLFDVETDEDGNTTYACKLNRTRNVWPVLKTADGRRETADVRYLYAPADGLANLTIYELGVSFTLFEAYLRTNEEKYAFELLGTIYRPSRGQTKEERVSGWKNSDRRTPYQHYESQAMKRAKMFETLPNLTVRALLFWFAGCRQAIVAAYPKVFKKNGDGGKAGANYGWGGVLLSVAEQGAMGPLEQVAGQHHSNVLTYLSMKEDEARETEKRMAEMKRKK